MTTIVVNGASHEVDLKTRDSSGKSFVRTALSYPQHIPKWYIWAEKGGEEDWYGDANERAVQFGESTFEETSKYFTHQTQGANVVSANGNLAVYKRIVAPDASRANLTLWLDLLPTLVDDYSRNPDGTVRVDNGQPIIVGQLSGFKYKWVMTHDLSESAGQTFTSKEQRAGTMVDPDNPAVRSTQYPMFGWRASSKGRWGDDVGVCLWPLDNRSDNVPEKLVQQQRTYPYALKLKKRDNKAGTVNTIRTALADEQVVFTFKSGSIDPTTRADMHMPTKYDSAYFSRDPRYPKQTPDLSEMVVYQDNIDAVLEALYAAELPHTDPDYHDFSSVYEDDKYMYNILTGRSLRGAPYRTYVPEVGSLSMDRHQVLYAQGGSDGTMTSDYYNAAFVADVRRYRDANDEYQDKAFHIENHMYDTGWPLNEKMELGSFISLRGDTFVTFGTFQEGERDFDNSEELSIASSIKTRITNFPESSWWGTGVMRAGIYGGSARVRGSVLSKRVSTTLEVAHKRSKYMGAVDGRWKNGYAYDDGAPGSVAEILYDFSKLWVPVSVRYRFWDAGLNWWARVDREQAYCPAFKTVYSDDTSVLTGDSVVMVVLYCNRANTRSHIKHSGTTGVSAAKFLKRITDYLNGQFEGRFDNRYFPEPRPSITGSDKLRGFSWHSGIEIFADPMRTVAVNYVEVFRNEDRGIADQLRAKFD